MKILRRNVGIAIFGICIGLAIIAALLVIGTRIHTKIVPKGNIALTTPYQTYLINEEITFTIHNNFNSSIILKNNCPTEPLDVFRYENNKWVRVHDTADAKACLSSQRNVVIPANSQKDASFAYWPHLFDKPGKYRIVAYIEYYEQLPFADFEVIDTPSVTAQASPGASNSVSSSDGVVGQETAGLNSVLNTATIPSRISQTIALNQGTIVAEYDSENIYILSITPNSGWRYEGGRSGREVEVTFKRSEQEIKVKLQIRNGVLTYTVEQDDD